MSALRVTKTRQEKNPDIPPRGSSFIMLCPFQGHFLQYIFSSVLQRTPVHFKYTLNALSPVYTNVLQCAFSALSPDKFRPFIIQRLRCNFCNLTSRAINTGGTANVTANKTANGRAIPIFVVAPLHWMCAGRGALVKKKQNRFPSFRACDGRNSNQKKIRRSVFRSVWRSTFVAYSSLNA